MYADDTTLIYAHKDLHSLQANINNDLKAINSYCKINQLYLNTSKSKAMIICPKKNINYNLKFSIGGNEIEQVSKFKFLGIIIDCHLTFSEHAAHVISTKLSSVNFVLYKLRSILPRHILLTLFNATGLSHIYYADIAYLANCFKHVFKKVESRLIDCGRTIMFNKKGSSRTLVRTTLNWYPLSKMVLYHQYIFLYNCIKCKLQLSSHITTVCHSYSTRKIIFL